MQVHDAEISVMLSCGTGKGNELSGFLLSYLYHLQTFVWVEIKIKGLDSPLFSVCALKKRDLCL